MSRKSRKRKRARKAGKRPKPARATAQYRQAVRQADQVLAENEVDLQPDTWPQIVMDWFAPEEPERGTLAPYIETHKDRLGVAWAREMLRLEVFLHVEDHEAIIAHYERALSRYPRCALVEMYLGVEIAREGGDWWRAHPMLLYAVEQLPDYARPCYELGFLHHLLGDFPGAVDWFNRAVSRLTEHDGGILASRTFYNRGVTRLMLDGDRGAAIADLKQALQHDPNYEQAKYTLRMLRRRKVSWTPW